VGYTEPVRTINEKKHFTGRNAHPFCSVHYCGMTLRFPSLLATACLLFAMHAGAQEIPGAGQNPSTSVDCSDPLLANSSLCSMQNQGLGQGQGSMSSPMNPSLPSSQMNLQQPSYFNYRDNDNLNRTGSIPQSPRVTLPPEPLTEFQKFVASTTGQVLPIYGADLFRRVPSTFAPLNMGPVPPDYVIGPGDELRIHVWGQINFSATVQVDRTGDIYLPQVGEVHAAGLPFSALDSHLRSAVSRVYRNFDLTVDLGQIRAIQVYLSGAARQPGVYTVSSLSTLADALFASGGPSASGSFRHVILRRAGVEVTDFDLYSLLLHGDKTRDVSLQNGDVLFIPPVGSEVAVTGSVRVPAIYELRKGETLSDAVADAGGTSAVAAQKRVSIERIDEHRDRYAMEVAWDQTGTTALADGDLIRVYSIIPGYEKTVTLRGNIANPGRFAWHAGMHVSDLVPDKDSLITRNYWWKRAQMGLPGPEFEPQQNLQNLRQPSSPTDLPRRTLTPQSGNDTSSGTQANDNAVNQNEGVAGDQSGADVNAGGSSAGAMGAGAAGVMAARNLTAAQRASSASLAVEQPTYATSMSQSGAPRIEIGPVAPEIDWDYAVIERLDRETLKTTLIPFDLGKLVLQHDASQDPALEPGDVVSIFSQGDIRVPLAQQTKFVRLEGEFVHAGVYTVQPGETLRDLVERAGGFTASAYLFGSEFTRESTRAIQQRRMDEYVEQQEMQMQRGNLALAAAATANPAQLASGALAQSSEQALIARLRQMRATGRIVLEFRAGSSGLEALPDIALEDGDRFVVPAVPASVNVVGAVYDQNSFLYATGRRAGTYLQLAGGPNRDSDRKHIFIIRADGSVVSRAAENGIWGNEFDALHMNPGDTIVVPDKTFKPSLLGGIIDWSQLFSQFALGAAALAVIQ
jgi:protein involved in polysaccharide export with SLBB domain